MQQRVGAGGGFQWATVGWVAFIAVFAAFASFWLDVGYWKSLAWTWLVFSSWVARSKLSDLARPARGPGASDQGSYISGIELFVDGGLAQV